LKHIGSSSPEKPANYHDRDVGILSGLTARAWAVIIVAKEVTMTYAEIVAMSLVRIASGTLSRR
jgi:hypothetical protein